MKTQHTYSPIISLASLLLRYIFILQELVFLGFLDTGKIQYLSVREAWYMLEVLHELGPSVPLPHSIATLHFELLSFSWWILATHISSLL